MPTGCWQTYSTTTKNESPTRRHTLHESHRSPQSQGRRLLLARMRNTPTRRRTKPPPQPHDPRSRHRMGRRPRPVLGYRQPHARVRPLQLQGWGTTHQQQATPSYHPRKVDQYSMALKASRQLRNRAATRRQTPATQAEPPTGYRYSQTDGWSTTTLSPARRYEYGETSRVQDMPIVMGFTPNPA